MCDFEVLLLSMAVLAFAYLNVACIILSHCR